MYITPTALQVVLINLGSGNVTNAVCPAGTEIWSIPGVPDLPAVSVQHVVAFEPR